MTKNEQLKQEAEVYSYKLYHSKAWNPDEDMLVKAYLAGAEPREKRIAELEAQIEKMKSDVMANIKWADEHKNNQMYFKLNSMFNQWEIKEKCQTK